MIGLFMPDGVYISQWTGSALLQLLAWYLLGGKPLPEPMMSYFQLYSLEQTLKKKFNQKHNASISFTKAFGKIRMLTTLFRPQCFNMLFRTWYFNTLFRPIYLNTLFRHQYLNRQHVVRTSIFEHIAQYFCTVLMSDEEHIHVRVQPMNDDVTL